MKQNTSIHFAILICAFMFIGSSPRAQENTPEELVSYSFKAPDAVAIGEVFEIKAIFNIQPGWYVYAPLAFNANQGKIVTKVTFRLPDGVEFVGSMVLPERGGATYTGKEVTMTQKLKIMKDFPDGQVVIPANVVYQTCNDHICYPPVREKINIEITIK
jgi:hypothetical protein